jgi:plasmid maintenance system antidote protein VapI
MKSKNLFFEKVVYRLQRKTFLKYSSNIAQRVMAAMEDRNDMNRKILAKTLSVSPQYISRITRGKENLTLDTIAKLSDALGVELITFPVFKDSFLPLDLKWEIEVYPEESQTLVFCYKTRDFDYYDSYYHLNTESLNLLPKSSHK